MGDTEEKPAAELIKGGVEIFKTGYNDLLHPVSKEAGKALETLGKSVNVALAPLRMFVWSFEQVEDYLKRTIEHKLRQRGVAPEHVISPNPDIAVPAVDALRYSKLKENYANLITSSMDPKTAAIVHPAFVEILKQMTADEARIIEFLPDGELYEPIMDLGFVRSQDGHHIIMRHVSMICIDAKCSTGGHAPALIDNLCRLGLTTIPPLTALIEDWRYDRIRQLQLYLHAKESVPSNGSFLETKLMLGLTPLGVAFRKACVDESTKVEDSQPFTV